jgi:hypothetical protein
MLTIACPECQKRHDWPDDWLGERVNCPECNKLITLSRPERGRPWEDEKEEREPPRSRYRGDEEDPDREPPRRRSRDDDEEDDRDRRVRRSVRRRDDDDEYDDRFVTDRPRREITCPRCDYVGRPDVTQEMAENFWLFIVLGIFFWPLLILGILMKQKWEVCPDCRHKLRKLGGTTFG